MRSQHIPDLNSEYACFVDAVDESEWNRILPLFRDATVNQTWAYCRGMSTKTSTVVLRQNGTIVAATILRLFMPPVGKMGVAYVGSGPMWRAYGTPDDVCVLRAIIRSLRLEYAVRRGLFLRISPNVFGNHRECETICGMFTEEGFKRKPGGTTLFVDLDTSLDDLRKGFHRKWRACLVKAELNGLTIRRGTTEELFKSLRGVYDEMLARKQYATNVDIDRYQTVYRALPELLRPTILLCESHGRPVAGVAISTSGETAVPWLLASSSEGRKCYAAYLVQWEALKMLKEQGCRTYDLGGCNPAGNPDTYLFKARMVGKKPEISPRVGIFDACKNPVSWFAVRSVEALGSLRRRLESRRRKKSVDVEEECDDVHHQRG